MKHVPAQLLQSDPQRVRLDAERRRIQASRDVMTVLDMLETSSSAVKGESLAIADRPGQEATECGRVLVVLFVHNISPVDSR